MMVRESVTSHMFIFFVDFIFLLFGKVKVVYVQVYCDFTHHVILRPSELGSRGELCSVRYKKRAAARRKV